MRLSLIVCLSLACPAAAWGGERVVPLTVGGGALRAAVAPDHGGELSSLQYRRHGAWVELLYRGGDYTPTPTGRVARRSCGRRPDAPSRARPTASPRPGRPMAGRWPGGRWFPEARFTTPQPLSAMPVRQPIPLGGYAGDPWLRLRDPGGVSLTIRHSGAPRPAGTPVAFNLWGDIGKGFFSPEPWFGRQNALVTGDGLVRLPPGERFGWTVVITLDSDETGRAAR